MSRPISKEKVKKSIAGSGGLFLEIAKKSGYSRFSVAELIKNDQELLALVASEEAEIDDIAENNIIKKIRKGDDSNSRWWLTRRRREKFGDNIDMTTGGEKLKIVIEHVRSTSENP
jgi:hypothetical protein